MYMSGIGPMAVHQAAMFLLSRSTPALGQIETPQEHDETFSQRLWRTKLVGGGKTPLKKIRLHQLG